MNSSSQYLGEDQFRTAFEYSAIGMALVSVEGRWLKVNAQVPKMFGYSESELLTKTFQELTHPEDLEKDLELVQQVLSGQRETYQMEKRYFHKNGSVVWGLLSVSLFRDADKQPVHFISQIEDITKRKIAEDEVNKLNQRLTAIHDSGTQVSIIGTDAGGLINYFSKGSETLLGYLEEEVIGFHSPALFHVKEEMIARGKELTQQFGRKIEGFEVFTTIPKQKKFESREWTYTRKDGTRFPVQLVVTPMRSEDDEIAGFIGIATDITERKDSEDKFKGLLESAPDAMVIVNQLGEIVFVNTQTVSLFGYDRDELQGKKVEILIPAELRRNHERHRASYHKNPTVRPMGEDFELLGKKKDGTEFPIEISLSPIETKEGVLVSAAIRDVTERKAAQKSLEDMAHDLTNRNKQLANFAHITSHNLRAPVSNLNSLLAIYHISESDEEKREIFDRFQKVIAHLSNTLNELVDAIKIQENAEVDREHLSFSEILTKSGEMMTAQVWQTKAEIDSDFDKAPFIHYNKHYLDSIFQNLLSNSLRYRSPDRNPEIRIRTSIENGQTVLTFADNGLGMDLEKHGHKLFGLHKTFHRHNEAKGVGLFITKTQVEAMGGTIEAESEIGKGTTFTITFGDKA
ncbi:MAG: PAS domain S-box protein [Cyclobacteriaceae bacterium]